MIITEVLVIVTLAHKNVENTPVRDGLGILLISAFFCTEAAIATFTL